MKAVLVDTGTAVYEQLAVPLSQAGVGLLQATSPMDAMEMTRAEDPEAVVINLTLPGRVGDLSFSLLRLEAATAAVPVVFLIDRLRWGRRANDAAADALVPVPWSAERVLDALCRIALRRNGAGWPAARREGKEGS